MRSLTSTAVHPTAVISEEANIAEGVTVGPYAVIGANVTIGKGCTIGSHACIDGHTTIGENNRIGRHACVGADPQDLGYHGEETYLEIGNSNFFGDFTQFSRGTSKSADKTTRIGNNNFLMAYVHVGHDCRIGDHNIIANATQIGGHVELEDHIHVGGLVALHQFLRVGRYSMVSGGSAANMDIAPFVRVAGYQAPVFGLNAIGIKRSGAFTPEEAKNLKTMYDIFFRIGGPLEETLKKLETQFPNDRNITHFVQFCRASERGISRCRAGSRE